MSPAAGEPEFDESVFDTPAAETGKPAEVAKAPEPAPEPDADAPKEPRLHIQDTAKKIGWAGKDEWKGDPEDWIDAPDFILKAAGEVLPSMRKSLEDAKTEIASLKKAVKTSIHHVSKARQEGYEQRSRELQAELDTFAAAGNVAGVRAVTTDIVELEKKAREEAPDEADDTGPELPPEFVAWREDNPWFGKDKALTAAASAIGDEALADGYTGKAHIKEVDRRLREQFPDKFAKPENPNRRLPGSVEGGGIIRRPTGKTFSDMPREAQEMCRDMVKLSGGKITQEAYVREHFAGDAK